MTVCFETVLELAQIAHQRNKLFMMNLSAPFICLVYAKQQMQVMPYVDIIFGNDDVSPRNLFLLFALLLPLFSFKRISVTRQLTVTQNKQYYDE